jgi:hypothetical protein
MELSIDLNSIYKLSEDLVARDVQGEFVIIPITSGIGDLDDEIFSLNNFGRSVWDKLDGKSSLKDIAGVLAMEFEGALTEIEEDLCGFLEELLKRKMLVKV